jgi:hypothetical protein
MDRSQQTVPTSGNARYMSIHVARLKYDLDRGAGEAVIVVNFVRGCHRQAGSWLLRSLSAKTRLQDLVWSKASVRCMSTVTGGFFG